MQSVLETFQQLAPGAVGLGLVVAATALLWLVVSQSRYAGVDALGARGAGGSTVPARAWLLPLALALVVGAALRLHELDAKSLTHPEAYVPGLPLLPDFSEPPPRHGFWETARWHFHAEPHPFGYYLAMWLWTKLFGTELAAIRLSSVLAGVVSIALIFRVASLHYGRTVGWIAAGLLALHGFHIFWSQIARMYAPGCFLGLLATWLLIEMTRGPRRRGLIEACYVAAVVAGVSTQLFFWPLFGAHILWAVSISPGVDKGIPRLPYVQALASPLLTHAAYMAGQAPVDGPTLRFLADFFSFGFLALLDQYSDPSRGLPMWAGVALLLFALALLGRGLFVRPSAAPVAPAPAAPEVWPLLAAAVGMSILMAGLAFVAYNRNWLLLPVSLAPLLGLLVLPAARLGSPLRGRLAALRARFAPVAALTSPIAFLAVVPMFALFALSFWVSVIAPRAFLIFVPYLLIVSAAGIRALARRPRVATPLGLALGAVLLLSVYHFKMTPTSARDYQALARALQARLNSADLVFIRGKDWKATPISFYLDHAHLVGADYAAAVAARPEARVWVVLFDGRELTGEMARALEKGFWAVDEVTARRAVGRLYVRTGQGGPEARGGTGSRRSPR